MSTATTRRPNYTTAWTMLQALTFDQLGLLYDRADAGLESGRSNALWLGRWDALGAELERRGVVAVKDGARWMVGYPEMFASCAA